MEQIYLLLRVALAEYFTSRRSEPCPLLFDEVTVHCDTGRREAILAILGEVSRSHQVIVFAAEDVVRDWAAREHPSASQELAPPGIRAP